MPIDLGEDPDIRKLVTDITALAKARPYAQGRHAELDDVFVLLRRYHAAVQGQAAIGRGIKKAFSDDDRWYGLALFHYGPEARWPLPARFLPPNAVPNTKGKLFEMLRRLKRSERTSGLRNFIGRVFSHTSQDYDLASRLYRVGARGQVNWVVSLIRFYALNKPKKGQVFHLLRVHHGTIKGNKDVQRVLEGNLSGLDRGYGLGLFRHGPEKKWPFPVLAKTKSKGQFFHELRQHRNVRTIWREGGRDRQLLKGLIWHVYPQYGDRVYAKNLCEYGPEPKWPAEGVKPLAKDKRLQPGITKEATGYKHVEGVGFIRGITYHDVQQRAIGDCYLMAALAAIASLRPGLLDKMIKRNPNGTYTVYFYRVTRGRDVVARVVHLLPGFPVKRGKRVYGQSGKRQQAELWVSILEKAYAVWSGAHGGYRLLNKGGSSSSVFQRMTGKEDSFEIGDVEYFSRLSYSLRLTEAQVKSKIETALRNKQPVAADTYSSPVDYKKKWKALRDARKKKAILEFYKAKLGKRMKDLKLISCHAYAVIGLSGSTVKLYNPHGELDPNRRKGDVQLSITDFAKLYETLHIGARLAHPRPR